jgi:hypothetical protein
MTDCGHGPLQCPSRSSQPTADRQDLQSKAAFLLFRRNTTAPKSTVCLHGLVKGRSVCTKPHISPAKTHGEGKVLPNHPSDFVDVPNDTEKKSTDAGAIAAVNSGLVG